MQHAYFSQLSTADKRDYQKAEPPIGNNGELDGVPPVVLQFQAAPQPGEPLVGDIIDHGGQAGRPGLRRPADHERADRPHRHLDRSRPSRSTLRRRRSGRDRRRGGRAHRSAAAAGRRDRLPCRRPPAGRDWSVLYDSGNQKCIRIDYVMDTPTDCRSCSASSSGRRPARRARSRGRADRSASRRAYCSDDPSGTVSDATDSTIDPDQAAGGRRCRRAPVERAGRPVLLPPDRWPSLDRSVLRTARPLGHRLSDKAWPDRPVVAATAARGSPARRPHRFVAPAVLSALQQPGRAGRLPRGTEQHETAAEHHHPPHRTRHADDAGAVDPADELGRSHHAAHRPADHRRSQPGQGRGRPTRAVRAEGARLNYQQPPTVTVLDEQSFKDRPGPRSTSGRTPCRRRAPTSRRSA